MWHGLGYGVLLVALALYAPQSRAAVDNFGDPLPPGAVARLGTVRFRPGREALCVAVSPDGKQIATVPKWDYGTFWIDICDAASGRITHKLLKDDESIWSIAWSPVRDELAVSNQQGIGIYDVRSGARRVLLTAAPDDPTHVAKQLVWSADGKRIAGWLQPSSTPSIQRVSVWNTETGAMECKLDMEQKVMDGSGAIGLSADGQTLGFGGRDQVRLIEVPSGRQKQRFELKGRVFSICLPPAGKTVVFELGQRDKIEFKALDLQTGEQRWSQLESTRGRHGLALADGGSSLVAASFSGELCCLDVATGKERWRTIAPAFITSQVAVASQANQIVTAHRCIATWDAKTGRQLAPSGAQLTDANGQLAVDPDNQTVRTLRPDGVWRWNKRTGRGELEAALISPANKMSLRLMSPDSRRVAAADEQQVLAQEPARRTILWQLKRDWPADQVPLGMSWSADGQKLVVGFGHGYYLLPGEVRVFAADTGKVLATTPALSPFVPGISPDGKLLALQGRGPMLFWDIGQKKVVGQMPEGYFPDYLFSGDSKTLFMPWRDKSLHDKDDDETYPVCGLMQWDIQQNKRIWQTEMPTRRITALALSADGRLVATAASGSGYPVYVWSRNTGKKVFEAPAHADRVTSLPFTPDGQYLLSASDDTSVLVWDLKQVRP